MRYAGRPRGVSGPNVGHCGSGDDDDEDSEDDVGGGGGTEAEKDDDDDDGGGVWLTAVEYSLV